MFADYGAPNDDSRAVARLAGELDPRLMITGGDNTYIVTLPQLLDDNLFGPLRDALSGAPNYGTVGDHDIPFPVGQKALADALEWPDLGERYDLRYGPVQVVALGLRADAVDVAFARRALARPGPLARFVVTHQPVKAGNPLLPVIAAAPVTAVLAGHLHAYERREVAGAPGVPFFTVGTGGAPRKRRADAPEPRRRRPPPGVRGDARPPGGRRRGVRVHGHRRRRPRPGHVADDPHDAGPGAREHDAGGGSCVATRRRRRVQLPIRSGPAERQAARAMAWRTACGGGTGHTPRTSDGDGDGALAEYRRCAILPPDRCPRAGSRSAPADLRVGRAGRLGHLGADGAEAARQLRVGRRQDLGGQQAGVAAAVDRHRRDGTPRGICTIDSSESMPSRAVVRTGTPITGSVVTAASIPGRWAAPPAPATMTFRPRSAASPP